MELFIAIAHAAEAAQETTATTGGIGALGVDWRALLYQAANFVILLYLLRRFAYPPILKMIEDRKGRIEESLKNVQEIEERNKTLTMKQDKLLKEARNEAKVIIKESHNQADQILTRSEDQAKERARQIIDDTNVQMQQQREEVRLKLRKEAATLVIRATEQIIEEKLDAKKDQTLIEKALRSAELDMSEEAKA